MKLTIINVISKLPDWAIDASDEYLSRINHGQYVCKMIDISVSKNNHKTPLENMLFEAKKITTQIPKDSFVIALDERGKSCGSIDFANHLSQITLTHPHITFIVGGADGLHSTIKNTANQMLTLSKFTYPHALARVVLLEQIYRAITILERHPYHRE